MNLYYEILGLQPGATQAEIKRAYFRLIRRYSPESDPERFQQIREAYEQLKNAQEAPSGPVFPSPSEPWAKKMLEQIEKYNRQRNNEKYRDACEEAWAHFPDEIQFLYMLNIAQRRCHNTGKAVKSSELLVKKEPENKWFRRELAFSYLERGYTKKAISAFEQAYQLGCQDTEFLLSYANACRESRLYSTGIPVLLQVIRQDKRWHKNEIQFLIESYMCLLSMNYYAAFHKPAKEAIQQEPPLLEILERLYNTLGQYGIYLKPHVPDIAMVVARTCVRPTYGSAEYIQVERVFDALRKLCANSPNEERVEEAVTEYYLHRVIEDSRICDTLARYIEIYYDLSDADSAYQKFAILDTQLCLIEQQDEVIAQANIIQKEHPQEYEKIAEFIEQLQYTKNIVHLKEKLQKTYRRLEPLFSCGYYYEEYPQEKTKVMGTRLDNSFPDRPYVRQTQKIGRNDPCPCGSGKKYKHCCMKK